MSEVLHVPGEYVYVVGCQGTRYAKIGYTNRVRRRLRTIQANCPYRLVQIRLFKGTSKEQARRLESVLHYSLRPSHIHGEWFQLSETDLSTIDAKAAECGAKLIFSGRSEVGLIRNASVGLSNRLPKSPPLPDVTRSTTKEAQLSLLREIQPMLQKHRAGTRPLSHEERIYVSASLRWISEHGHYKKFVTHLRSLL